MKHWTPQTVCMTVVIFTVCSILLMIQIGVLRRSELGDVEASRNLLDGNLKLIIGALLGYLTGSNVNKNKP